MKLLVTLAVCLTMISSFARDVSPKELVEIESQITLQKEDLERVVSKLNRENPKDGQIVATMINEVEMIHAKVESIINSDLEISREKVQDIEKKLKHSEELINELAK